MNTWRKLNLAVEEPLSSLNTVVSTAGLGLNTILWVFHSRYVFIVLLRVAETVSIL